MVEDVAVLTRELRVRLLNCSASGCLVETNVRLDVSTVASLSLQFGGQHFADDVLVAWCRAIAGSGARYHVGLRFIWTAAAAPNTLRMMSHQLVATAAQRHGDSAAQRHGNPASGGC
jgi:hypothetical protein